MTETYDQRIERIARAIAEAFGCYCKLDSPDGREYWAANKARLLAEARAADAISFAAALSIAEQIIEKWDPISDRWANMPHLPSGIKQRMLQQLAAHKLGEPKLKDPVTQLKGEPK